MDIIERDPKLKKQYTDKGGYIDHYPLISKIIDSCYPEIPKNRHNIVKWFFEKTRRSFKKRSP